MTESATGWRARLPAPFRPYVERVPLGALLLGMSSGFPYAMIGATLTTRLAQDGIDKRAVTAFSLAFLVYNFKVLWAPAVDRYHLPWIGRYGQRRSWLWLAATFVALAVAFLALADPRTSRCWSASRAPPSTS
jgi:MFS transporter, PAT family, beta-lactamase induction signal transducer AmpG